MHYIIIKWTLRYAFENPEKLLVLTLKPGLCIILIGPCLQGLETLRLYFLIC